MKKTVSAFIAAFHLFSAPVLRSAELPNLDDKIKVHVVIMELRELSGRSLTLDEFGSKSMGHGKQVLDMGGKALYALSAELSKEDDWKVRYWIVDIMGYLGNLDASRPLNRVLNNAKEKEPVKERALMSLKKLGR